MRRREKHPLTGYGCCTLYSLTLRFFTLILCTFRDLIDSITWSITWSRLFTSDIGLEMIGGFRRRGGEEWGGRSKEQRGLFIGWHRSWVFPAFFPRPWIIASFEHGITKQKEKVETFSIWFGYQSKKSFLINWKLDPNKMEIVSILETCIKLKCFPFWK